MNSKKQVSIVPFTVYQKVVGRATGQSYPDRMKKQRSSHERNLESLSYTLEQKFYFDRVAAMN